MFKIQSVSGGLGRERLRIRSFRFSHDMHRFLNRGDNALRWREYGGPLRSGTYARLGGEWRSTRDVEPSLLNHV